MKSFKYACQKYLTKEEGELLSYDQKINLLNMTVKQELGNWRYEKMTSNKDITNQGGIDYSGIGETLDALPMTDRQRSICRYKYQQYTIEEISQLINVSEATINRELANIKTIMLDNKDLLEPKHETIHKKSTSYNE